MQLNTIHIGDALTLAQQLPDQYIQTIVTSPPYWGLRDYGTGVWQGGDPACDHSPFRGRSEASNLTGHRHANDHALEPFLGQTCPKCGAERIDKQIGLEPTVEAYIHNLVSIFSELRRALRDDGTLWLNLGDTYARNPGRGVKFQNGNQNIVDRQAVEGNKGPNIPLGLKEKDLIGLPWRVAFALQADGWYLRRDIIWHKPNCMPESVQDRPTCDHEYIFLLSKNSRYYYDIDAIREPIQTTTIQRSMRGKGQHKHLKGAPGQRAHSFSAPRPNLSAGFTRKQGKWNTPQMQKYAQHRPDRSYPDYHPNGRNKRSVWTVSQKGLSEAHFATFPPDLIEPCVLAGCPEGGIVCDPFIGSGTTALVARQNNRQFIGFELNPNYVDIALPRLEYIQPRLPESNAYQNLKASLNAKRD